MLRKRSGKSTSHLNLRNSTSSLRPDTVDPAVSRQYAQAAATYAFARAQERNSADSSGRDGRSHGELPLSHRGTTIGQANPEIRRQRSVRFAGPNAVPRRQSIGTRASKDPIGTKESTETLRPRALTIDVPVPAEYRPPSRSSSLGRASVGRGKAENFVTALAAYHEYYTREDDVASTPSSYKRVRKSKSMFSPTKIPNVVFNNGSPEIPARVNKIGSSSVGSVSNPPEYTLKAPKSMSFLRGGHDYMPPKIRQEHDAAVQIARDRFLHQLEQQRLNKQPSFIFRSRARREEKGPFRQSVRSSSTANSYGLPIVSNNSSSPVEETTLRIKARKASTSFKNKFKRIFRLGEADESAIPYQQVIAQETHVRDYMGASDHLHERYLDVPNLEGERLSYVTSRAPSFHAIPSNQQLRSTAGSMESLRSAVSFTREKSGVTSWNSTEENTMASRHAAAERERQRLSVINEDGTHVSMPTQKDEKLMNQYSSYPHLGPLPYMRHLATSQITSPVDSQRVYSALMKRLDENSPQAKLEAQRNASQQSCFNPVGVPARTSSTNGYGNIDPSSTTQSTATIRRVYCSDPSDSQDDAVNTRPPSYRSHSGHGHEVSPNPLRPHKFLRQMNSISTFHSATSNGQAKYIAHARRDSGTVPDITPQQLESQNEPTPLSLKVVRQQHSTFFPSAAVSVARTTSPYRCALAEAENRLIQQSTQDMTARDAFGNHVSDIARHDKQDRARDTYTESIYSRTTSGRTPVPDSAISLPSNDDLLPVTVPVGNATVVHQATYRPIASAHRATSSAGSIEWRNWMSAQVSSLNPTSQQAGAKFDAINYALPSMPKSYGHIREDAQISDDDTEIKTRTVTKGKQPLAMVQQNAPLQKPVGILKKNSQVSLINNDENIDGKLQASWVSTDIPLAPPLPIPQTYIPARLTKSRSSLRSINVTNASHPSSAAKSAIKLPLMSHRTGLRNQASSTTLRSIDTPAKVVKKNRKGSKGTITQPSPGIDATAERQFGTSNITPYSGKSDSSKFGTPRTGLENYSPHADVDDAYGFAGAGLTDPETDAQAMGSQRMVDLFLNSRRRRIHGSEETNAFL